MASYGFPLLDLFVSLIGGRLDSCGFLWISIASPPTGPVWRASLCLDLDHHGFLWISSAPHGSWVARTPAHSDCTA